ncbi:MAG: hypothetical protein MRJ93_12730 [Nitrososphaeraceae archaeon]|nr:hypothetical protein [Nitrososphaeraceae archaeon]
MNIQKFNEFLKYTNSKNQFSDIQKIKIFMEWCNKNNYEEILLRLCSQEHEVLGNSSLLDFTTKRIISRQRSFLNKFLDLGYVAGMGPFPYMILSTKKQNSKIKNSSNFNLERILNDPNLEYSIDYDSVQEVIIDRGSNTVVRNMFGSFISKNYLSIIAKNKTYEYILPAKKNGDFFRMSHWLKILPVKVSINLD